MDITKSDNLILQSIKIGLKPYTKALANNKNFLKFVSKNTKDIDNIKDIILYKYQVDNHNAIKLGLDNEILKEILFSLMMEEIRNINHAG